jgi:uncharacterized protein YjbI with pentapeptide repeats
MARIETIPECNATDKKGKVFGWCSEHEVVYLEGDNHYCVFHAPIGKKKVSAEKFNDLVNKKIRGAIVNNIKCDFSGTVFEGDFQYTPKATLADSLLPDLNFSYAEFQNVDFNWTTFKRADFRGAAFKYAEFQNVKFSGATFFSQAKFISADFSGSEFYERTVFRKANFHLKAIFNEVEFKQRAVFVNAKFNMGANFNLVVFQQNAFFNDAKFNQRAEFKRANFHKTANFNNAVFLQSAYFRWSKFQENVDFRSTKFKRAFFADVKFDTASFEETIFQNTAIFRKAHIKEELVFILCNFQNAFGDFRDLVFKKDILFQRTKMHKATFVNTNIRSCKFFNCDWNEEGERYILHDEKLLGKKDIYFKREFDKVEDRIKAVESLYRANKQRSGEMHNQTDYSKWHMSEKEMQCLRTPIWSLNGLFLNAYKLFSGYGENPLRAGTWLATLVVLAILTISTLGIAETKENKINRLGMLESFQAQSGETSYINPSNIFETDTTFFYTLETLVYMKTPDYKPYNNWTRAARIFFRLATTLQFTLFAFALRNRFRR